MGFYRAVLPFGILFLLSVIILALSTVLTPPEWVREEVNEETGESMGRCSSGIIDGLATLLLLVITVMAGIYAWKTRDVDSAYSESWWILMLILLQLELFILAIPVLLLLEDLSTDGYYFGNVILSFLFPITTLLFIMVPKVSAHYKAQHPTTARAHQTRGSGGHGTVRVSGVPDYRHNNCDVAPLGSSHAATTTTRGSSSAQEVIELTGPSLQAVIAQGQMTPTAAVAAPQPQPPPHESSNAVITNRIDDQSG